MTSRANIRDIVDRHAHDPRMIDKVAFSMDDEHRTFGEIAANADGVAYALSAMGVTQGDRIAIFMGNCLEWVDLVFGAATMGAVCVPINVLMTGDDVNRIMEDAAPKVLVVDALAEPVLRVLHHCPETIITVGEVDVPKPCTTVSWQNLGEAPEASFSWEIGGDDVAMMYYTSGTTGHPKAAVHSHDGILWNTLHQIHDLRLDVNESHLVVPSFSWGGGFHDVTLALTWLGGHNQVLPTGGSTLERIVRTLEEHRVSRALLVPTLLRELLGRPDLVERINATGLRRIMSGAEPVSAALTNTLAAAMPEVTITQTFGMTEFPMIATVIQPEDAVAHAGTAGRASLVCEVGVVTDEGAIVFTGTGEIVIKSPATTSGYRGQPEENARSFRDGWFYTGDTGSLDDDGFLTVTGRSKDMIITGGINVYPREIEEVIQRLPRVAEVAVVGVPDDRWGESIVAVVVPRGEGVTEEEISHACREQLSKFKRPKQVIIGSTPLPKTVTGKILKRQIREDVVRQLTGSEIA